MKWISTTKRLLNEADGLEKKQQAYLNSSHEVDTLRELKLMNRERADYTNNVRKKVEYFQSLLLKIHLRLNDAKGGQNHLAGNSAISANMDRQAREVLQNLLETFESRISSFKLTMRTEFDQLEALENELSSEIQQIDRLIDEIQHEEAVEFKGPEEAAIKAKQDRERIEQENKVRLQQDMEHKAAVGEIDRELARLGRYGSWDVRDHDVFLRVWTAVFTGIDLFAHGYDNISAALHETNGTSHVEEIQHLEWHLSLNTSQQQALMKRLKTDVFAKTPEELQAHIDWYCRVLELTQRKKQLLADWRKVVAHRQRKEQGEKAAAIVTEATGHRADEMLIVEDLMGELEMTPAEEEKRREQRIQAKQRLTKWRQEKQQKEEEEKRRKAEGDAQKQRESAAERKRRQSELHTTLAQYKQEEKLRQWEEKERQKTPERPKSADSAAMRRRQQSDMEKARLRKAQADEVQQKKTERERRLSEIPVSTVVSDIQRDPARLLAGTRASEAGRMTEVDLDAAQYRRMSQGAHLANVAMSGRDLRFATRATPQWLRPPTK